MNHANRNKEPEIPRNNTRRPQSSSARCLHPSLEGSSVTGGCEPFFGLSVHRNWIKLWRKVEDSAVFYDTNAWHLFCYLLIKAQYRENKYSCSFEGKQVYLQRGEVVFGRHIVAKHIKMPPSTVRDALDRLCEKYRVISKKADNKATIVTILNWGTYQNEETKPDNNPTTTRQQPDTKQEGKERKEKKKYGEYKNILLKDSEFHSLKEKFGERGANDRIRNMDEAIALKGYKYKSHYLAILKWEKNNKDNKNPYEDVK